MGSRSNACFNACAPNPCSSSVINKEDNISLIMKEKYRFFSMCFFSLILSLCLNTNLNKTCLQEKNRYCERREEHGDGNYVTNCDEDYSAHCELLSDVIPYYLPRREEPNLLNENIEEDYYEHSELSSQGLSSDSGSSHPIQILKNIKHNNIHRLTIASLNINGISNKFDSLVKIVKGYIDILVIIECKLDCSFTTQQFKIEGFASPFRLDRDLHGGGVLIYVREDIGAKILPIVQTPENFFMEGIFFEINLRKCKWLIFGGYCNKKANIGPFLRKVGSNLDYHMCKVDNFLLLGDFNSEIHESLMKDFCESYNLRNLIKEPTCFKNLENPSTIDLILTNRPKSFLNCTAVEVGLSDHHKLVMCTMRSYFPKQAPILVKYRNYKHFDNSTFRTKLWHELPRDGENINYETFENIFMKELNSLAPTKEKYLRANDMPYILCSFCS